MSPERIAERAARVPDLSYPPELPVSAARADIAAAIRDHQVVVIAGETGSGKTTQIPKICLELGRGITGVIGHTQPRRIAARSVAERLAEEMDVELGSVVGYQVRFTDRSTQDTLVKVMTDGILLNELQRDRELRRYDTLIIDEAHERSLNIDFILGYLKQLLPRRPDLKVIITSATIDPQRFAEHFADASGVAAPIIEVSGRTYPVEIRYRPLVRTEPGPKGEPVEVGIDQVTGICEAVEELWTETPLGSAGPRDILVFLSGEQEIRDAADALTGMQLPRTEILPLYARLSAAEQHRVFGRAPAGIDRRVVLATNVAETSLTVPGIRYVVDAGTARISRYSQRLKVQRLPIEPISQASARQRSGRCGRLADGVAIRLYSEADFEARPQFTEPEILRTNLASVILQMTALGLGDLSRFPFVEPPDARQVTDGIRLLEELGAFATGDEAAGTALTPGGAKPRRGRGRRLTAYGRQIAAIPADPRMARMLIEAHANGCLREALVIVSGLSIQDPRERPAEFTAQADQAHARHRDEKSDFITWLNLWDYLRRQQKQLSGSAFRRMCKAEYLHYLRVREWQDLHAQLRGVVRSLGMELNDSEPSPDAIHQSMLAGLLSHVGLWDDVKREYAGARGASFAIQPGSVLFRKNRDWVMAAELVETTRLWARTVAAINPEWIESLAAHLVKRSYSEPHWSRDRASAVAAERVTLYGVPVVAGRTVSLGSIDPVLSRELFIRHALVEGDWDTRHHFFHDNLALVARLEELEERARRRDILVDDQTLVDFYEARIPEHVVSGAHFDAWWKRMRHRQPQLLTFTEDLLVSEEAAAFDENDYPRIWRAGELELSLSYQFEPGSDADGVTVHIPIEVLNQVPASGFDWQVPGLREELAIALVRSLPKATRKHFVPAPDMARRAMAEVATIPEADREAFTEELGRALFYLTGHRVPSHEWDPERVPDHLRMTFRVTGAKGRVLGEGTSLDALQAQLAGQVRTSMAKAASGVERSGLTAWPVQPVAGKGAGGMTMPPTFARAVGGRTVQGYPALVDKGDSVALEVLASPSLRDQAHRLGVRRLLLLNTSAPWTRVLSLLSNQQKLALGHNPHGSVPALLDDCLAAAVDAIVAETQSGPVHLVRTGAEFDEALRRVQAQVVGRVIDIVELVIPVLDEARRVGLGIEAMTSPALSAMRADLSAQLARLIRPGFVADVGADRLRHLARWLRGMSERMDKGPQDVRRDSQRMEIVHAVMGERDALLAKLPPERHGDDDVRALDAMIEELRVSLFAQRLGTAHPVSEKRIFAAMDAVEDATVSG